MDTKKIVADLRAERARIDAAIAALEALSSTATVAHPVQSTPKTAAGKKTKKKRVLSPEARQRIADAVKKRWARQKKAAAAGGAANKKAS